MPKINYAMLRRKPKQTFIGHFIDKDNGVNESREFRVLSQAEKLAALDDLADLVKLHITGSEDALPQPVGVVGDEPVYGSRSAFEMASVVAFAQTEIEPSERYTPAELVHLMVSEELLDCIQEIYLRVVDAKDAKGAKKDPLAENQQDEHTAPLAS